jgi:endonuclease/exonuclease/phosphatase family metal-dependent hydrolase
MKFLFRLLLWVAGIPAILILLLVLYATVTDYRPREKEVVYRSGTSCDTLSDTAVFSMLIWNIGYGGLDGKMDFFYDGGIKVRTPAGQLKKNLTSLEDFIKGVDTVDFILLQEVDVSGKRSYYVNEVQEFTHMLGDRNTFYGKNYDVFFVPLPFSDPMGSVNSGLLSRSRFKPADVTRISFPGRYGWPKRLFMLDRCFLVMRFPISDGKQLLVINTHNEAYDNGSIRDQQMAYLKNFLQEEYAMGNYIVVAGDWNQCPPDLKPEFTGELFDTIDFKGIGSDYLPSDWTWAFDNTVPSNRRLDTGYSKGKTRTTLIDFFLLSPNLRATGCRTTDLSFANSDHQPVQIKISLVHPQQSLR